MTDQTVTPAIPLVEHDDVAPPPDHFQSQALYAYGNTAFFSCRRDPRFTYCLYVPPDLQRHPERAADLVVLIHGTRRHVESLRNAYAGFGRWNHCIVLVPLFPIGVRGDDYRDGYKYFIEGDIRYDHLLFDMVDEVAQRYRQRFIRFGMFGFSGGGQFVNRFCLLYPEYLWAASIGAPGHVTVLDMERDWWVGTRNVHTLFGRKINRAELQPVPVQLVVGAQDTETWEITVREGEPQWMEGANDAGATRIDRLKTLAASLEDIGVKVRLDVIPGAAHDVYRCTETVSNFLAQALSAWRTKTKPR